MDVKRLGRAILHVRLGRDWSQEDLARRADVATSYISKLERGLVPRPGVTTLDKVLGAMGFGSIDALLSAESGEPPTAEPPPRAMAAHTDDGSELTDSELRIARTVARMVIDELKREEREGKGQADGDG